jgi:hypothetical protein
MVHCLIYSLAFVPDHRIDISKSGLYNDTNYSKNSYSAAGSAFHYTYSSVIPDNCRQKTLIMAQAYQPAQLPVTDSVQERIENGVSIEDVQQAYVQLQSRYVILH